MQSRAAAKGERDVKGRVIADAEGGDHKPAVYCPRCRQTRRREEWRRIWRRLQSGSPDGHPVEVLRHRDCDEIVYVLL